MPPCTPNLRPIRFDPAEEEIGGDLMERWKGFMAADLWSLAGTGVFPQGRSRIPWLADAAGSSVTVPAAAPPPRVADRRDVPVLINSFNRLDGLSRLVRWLRDAGQRHVIILDNDSSFPPLLAYLRRVEAAGDARVVPLGGNLGHLALWKGGLLQRLGITTEFVYTDPDVLPAPACPQDAIGVLQRLLREEPAIHKAGLGMLMDDIPDHYPLRSAVLAWERQYWTRPVAPGLFLAPIDTTFALYRPGAAHGLGRLTLRTGEPYLARHLGWYADGRAPTPEEAFYARTARPGISHWSVPGRNSPIAGLLAQAPPASALLRLAAGGAPIHGYVTRSAAPLDLGTASVDGILVERWRGSLPWGEMARVARPGARLLLRCRPGPPERQLDRRPTASWWRWLRRPAAIGPGWAAERLALVHRHPAEVALQLRRTAPGDGEPPPPAVRVLEGRCDLDADLAAVADGARRG